MEGGCSCGAVRYRLTAKPMFTHCCHCMDCQKQTGGAFAINALIETDRIEMLKGAPVATSMPTESGRAHDVYRCAQCQVAVWSDYGRRPALRFVRVATLDDPKAIAPDVHIFTRSKQPWVGLPADVPTVEIYYDMQALWPKESLERRKAILG
ncbi:MAG: GFA family protein [Alphaproteobacteria bacterium]|nr:GFA family protein [Alphaproteobacteria bacterium]